MQLADRGDDEFDLLVGKRQSLRNRVLTDFHRAGLNHDDGLFRGHHDDIQLARFLLSNGRVRNQFAFE